MKTHQLLTKLYFRFLKEENIFYIFKPYVNYKVISNVKNVFDHTQHNLLTCLYKSIQDIHSNEILNDEEMYDFIYNDTNLRNFNEIMLITTSKLIINFLNERNLTNKFIDNYKKQNKDTCNIIYSKSNNKYSNEETINKHFLSLESDVCTPLSFFSTAFRWSATDEGDGYWRNINEHFRRYLWGKLID